MLSSSRRTFEQVIRINAFQITVESVRGTIVNRRPNGSSRVNVSIVSLNSFNS